MKVKVAITGGIGSGKSTVGAILSAWGYPVYSCDEIYKDIIKTSAYLDTVKREFPHCVIGERIDKKKLSETVFRDQDELRKLNCISHPLIMQALRNQMKSAEGTLVFAEVPLLFEGKFENEFNAVIVVIRSLNERITAVRERDQISEEKVLARISKQFDYDSALKRGDFQGNNFFVLQNDIDLQSLECGLKKTIETLEKQYNKMKH